jgi:hypothetical protein
MSQAGSGCSWRVIARICARESIVVFSAGHLLFLANEIGLDRVGEGLGWRLGVVAVEALSKQLSYIYT